VASFSYTPVFQHDPWFERVDLVEATGPKGFNIRFETIQSDLQAVSTTVTAIGTAFDQLSARVPVKPPTAVLSVAPLMQANGASVPWQVNGSGHAVAAPSAGANGVLHLTTLPDHIVLTSLKVRGAGTPPSGQKTAFFVTRVNVNDGTTFNHGSFDTPAIDTVNTLTLLGTVAERTVDLSTFRYVITANTGPATGTPVTLFSFQLSYNNL